MGKYSKSMRAWSEKQLAQFICQVFDEEIQRYTGPQGPPGAQGIQGAPGTCVCAGIHTGVPLPYWQQPIISYTDMNTAHVIYEGVPTPPLMQSVPYTCGCTWVGLAESVSPQQCPNHPLSGEKK